MDTVTDEELAAAKAEYLRLSAEYTARGRGRWERKLVTNQTGGAYYMWPCVEEPSMTNEELLPLSRAMDRYCTLLWDYNGGSFRPKGETSGQSSTEAPSNKRGRKAQHAAQVD